MGDRKIVKWIDRYKDRSPAKFCIWESRRKTLFCLVLTQPRATGQLRILFFSIWLMYNVKHNSVFNTFIIILISYYITKMVLLSFMSQFYLFVRTMWQRWSPPRLAEPGDDLELLLPPTAILPTQQTILFCKKIPINSANLKIFWRQPQISAGCEVRSVSSLKWWISEINSWHF